jgi:hypothetical protein
MDSIRSGQAILFREFVSLGYFRLSLTASDEMIDRALPNFEKALQMAQAR